MSNTPSDEELNSVLCHHWPAFSMQAVLVKMWLRDAMRAALAKWGTPQPVAREPELDQFLSDVMTAAGLVTHGKQCKQLGARLGAAAMKLRVHNIPQKGCD